MAPSSVDAVITDPPYCSGGWNEATKGTATHQGLRSQSVQSGRVVWFDGDNMGTAGLVWLLRQVAVEAFRVLHEAGSLLVFCDWRMAVTLAPALESAGFRFRNLIVWDKGNAGLGSGFRARHELILHLTMRAPVFHAADVGNVIPVPRVTSSDRDHPTEKPISLLRTLVRVVCPSNGIVVDPFCGSGTTGEAALAEGRRFHGIERAEEYAEIARERLKAAERQIPLPFPEPQNVPLPLVV